MMKPLALLTAASLLVLALSGCSMTRQKPDSPQMAPGTVSRPVLSAAEAARFTPETYFAHRGSLSAPVRDPWNPKPLRLDGVKPDFTVGSGAQFASVQQAVNAAIASGKTTRQYIHVAPGTYNGAVYVPIDAPPITLYGSGQAEAVKIQLTLDARTKPAVYVAAVNPAGQFKAGDPAWTMYNTCATLPADKVIDTPCAAVMWSQSVDFQLANLSVINTLLDTVDAETHQAVALRIDGDRSQLENVRLISRQDTFLINVGEAPTAANKLGTYPTDRIARAYVRNSYVEGDIDFVFGRANAVFDGCEFRAVSTRKNDRAVIFAPDTVPASSLGFLVINSRITGDKGFEGSGKVYLGRSWDQGAGGTGYLVGQSPNGQIVIRDSYIDSSIKAATPWDQAATTNRPHKGNIAPDRNLDDPALNRLWEYNNYGPGAR
ncbi:putative acyl-CoA thioester hydrolase [Uliginosibacterium paludis]|uniref:Pectinesterase n=1 Tax=Uliginosibacterium paludis TaxID=1615952 RepID=A0ABV2CN02_9RHOO